MQHTLPLSHGIAGSAQSSVDVDSTDIQSISERTFLLIVTICRRHVRPFGSTVHSLRHRIRPIAHSTDAEHSTSSSSSAPQPPAATNPTSTSASASNSSGSNAGLAGGAVAAGAALFFATRLLTGGPSLAALEQESIPLDVALNNGRPTVVEFYANW